MRYIFKCNAYLNDKGKPRPLKEARQLIMKFHKGKIKSNCANCPALIIEKIK